VKIEDAIQQREFASAQQKLTVNMVYSAGLLSFLHQRFLREFDLTPQQFNVLRILRGQRGTQIGVNDISQRMLDPTSNASRIVEKLRLKNLITRETCATDRRQAHVFITPAGLRLLEQIDQKMKAAVDHFDALTLDEITTLNQLLDKMREGAHFQQLFNERNLCKTE
jgi:DNA-binding MarR family transcriptional regulator